MDLNFERIASLSTSAETELVERIAISKQQKQQKKGQKRLQKTMKKQKQDFGSLSPSQRAKKKNPPPGTPESKSLGQKPGVPSGAGPGKKKPPAKPGSKRAIREERMAKVPEDQDKGKAYCVQQSSPKNGHPMIWVRPSGNRRQFCRSLGPKEVRRLRKKLRNKAKGKGEGGNVPKSLRALLRIMKGVRPDIAAGETMGDVAIRRRMRRQLGNILAHGGMSKERMSQVAKGKPQAIKAFKKMMSGRGMGQMGMQDMTDPKKLTEKFETFVENAEASGMKAAVETAKADNMESNKSHRAKKGLEGDGFDKLRAQNRDIRQSRKKQQGEDAAALADTELSGPGAEEAPAEEEETDWDAVTGDASEEDLSGPREGGGAAADADEDAATRRRLGLPPGKAASEPLFRAACQKFLRRRRVTAAVTVIEDYNEYNPMLAEGNWRAMQLYAMHRTDCHASLDRIAAKSFLLV